VAANNAWRHDQTTLAAANNGWRPGRTTLVVANNAWRNGQTIGQRTTVPRQLVPIPTARRTDTRVLLGKRNRNKVTTANRVN
jgi:hypothetical protein